MSPLTASLFGCFLPRGYCTHAVAKTITIGYCVPDTDARVAKLRATIRYWKLDPYPHGDDTFLFFFFPLLCAEIPTLGYLTRTLGGCAYHPHTLTYGILANDDITSDNARVRSRFVRTDYAARVVAIINFFSLHYPRRRT